MVKLSDVSRLMTRAFMAGVKAPAPWSEDDMMEVLLSAAEALGLDPSDTELDLRLRVQVQAGRKYLALALEEQQRFDELVA